MNNCTIFLAISRVTLLLHVTLLILPAKHVFASQSSYGFIDKLFQDDCLIFLFGIQKK